MTKNQKLMMSREIRQWIKVGIGIFGVACAFYCGGKDGDLQDILRRR